MLTETQPLNKNKAVAWSDESWVLLWYEDGWFIAIAQVGGVMVWENVPPFFMGPKVIEHHNNYK